MKTYLPILAIFVTLFTVAKNDLLKSKALAPSDVDLRTIVHKDTSMNLIKFMDVELQVSKNDLEQKAHSTQFIFNDKSGSPLLTDLKSCVTMHYFVKTDNNFQLAIQFLDLNGNWSEKIHIDSPDGKGYHELPIQVNGPLTKNVNISKITGFKLTINAESDPAIDDFYIDELAFKYVLEPADHIKHDWKNHQERIKNEYNDRGNSEYHKERERQSKLRGI